VTVRLLAAPLVACALGCHQTVLLGPPTESTCAADSTLTYANFGQPFMAAYCTRCHASTLSGSQRHGAPLLHDFDTLYGIQPFIAHIDETTASGPAATNTAMPYDGAMPSLGERQMLGEWLACGIPP